MFFEKIRSEGLAQLSYIAGDAGSAFVVDPRRDCDIYREIADREGAQITRIYETHRNEDFVIGSCELADMTGATIFHGSDLPFEYGETVDEGDLHEFGNFSLRILKTPGHTDESISLVLADKSFSDQPLAVFTGDALFIGDVGRTDFFPERAEEVAGLLFDSIFKKLLLLGDQVLLYPAHGAGSVCGSGMASREFSSIGYERMYNPALQVDSRETFIRNKLAEKHYSPPYFKQMEQLNLKGQPRLNSLPHARPLNAKQFTTAIDNGFLVLDTRSAEAFSGASIPGSLAIPLDMIPAYAGWFVPYDQEICIVVQNFSEVETAKRYLVRLGYEKIRGFLDEGLHAWEISGKEYQTIPSLYAGDLKKRLDSNENLVLLDVRKDEEVNRARLPGSRHIFLGELPEKLNQLPDDRPIITFCGSGQRAIIAASILKQNGFGQVENCLGSMAACRAIGCRIDS
ncbi:MAG TPA: MBL fold metallo-hydrolase [Geopsychrobacteraceae bacterium]|nr:MBL fold metallo-hydrolase [Geopsychrobacteraceae bacterium]